MVENTYLITPKDLAERLGITDRCLRERRALGRSLPKYVRVGRFIRYRPKDVEEWINSLAAEGGGAESDIMQEKGMSSNKHTTIAKA